MNMSLEQYEKRVRIAELPKWQKWCKLPVKHVVGFGISYGLYRFIGPVKRKSRLYSGQRILVPLPAGLDIYLTGIKAHDSEIRLGRFLFKTYNDVTAPLAFDCGAHIGFYSLLMSQLFDQVVAFEASPDMHYFLKRNTQDQTNIVVESLAVSDHDGQLEFFKLPVRYSESSTSIESAVPEAVKDKAHSIVVPCVSLDSYCSQHEVVPDLIKIDVEGAEFPLLKGAESVLTNENIVVVLEVRKDEFANLYSPAIEFLRNLGYESFSILQDGSLTPVGNISKALEQQSESDNFVFKKS